MKTAKTWADACGRASVQGSVVLVRVVLGGYFFWAGWTKVTAAVPWSAASYLEAASGPFAQVFRAMAGSGFVDALNMWGLTLIGLALVLGAFVRPAAMSGFALMILYYLAHFSENTARGVIDDHLIFASLFLLFVFLRPGLVFGLDGVWLPALKKTAVGRWLVGV